jgi:hypothetical protein
LDNSIVVCPLLGSHSRSVPRVYPNDGSEEYKGFHIRGRRGDSRSLSSLREAAHLSLSGLFRVAQLVRLPAMPGAALDLERRGIVDGELAVAAR